MMKNRPTMMALELSMSIVATQGADAMPNVSRKFVKKSNLDN